MIPVASRAEKKYSCSETVAMNRPTPEVRDFDLQVQSRWVRNLDLYLNEAMIEAEKLN